MKKFWHPILYLIFFWQKLYDIHINAQEFDKNKLIRSALQENCFFLAIYWQF